MDVCQGQNVGEVTRWSKWLVHKCRIATTVPLHHIPCINPPTLWQIEPRKFLGLEISGYLILQDLLITSLDFSCPQSKSCSKQVTGFSKLRHQVYHHNQCARSFGKMLSFSKHGNQIAQMNKLSHLCQLFFKILFQQQKESSRSSLNS